MRLIELSTRPRAGSAATPDDPQMGGWTHLGSAVESTSCALDCDQTVERTDRVPNAHAAPSASQPHLSHIDPVIASQRAKCDGSVLFAVTNSAVGSVTDGDALST
jgi:hypothetical protein